MEIKYIKDESIWIVPLKECVNIGYSIQFDNEDDIDI